MKANNEHKIRDSNHPYCYTIDNVRKWYAIRVMFIKVIHCFLNESDALLP